MLPKLYALSCGELTVPNAILFAGAEGVARVPIPSYLIVHDKGMALFDSGYNPAVLSDPVDYLGADLDADGVHADQGDLINNRLESAGFDPAKINFIINSHLHFDHAGGNALLPNADLVVQRREWAHVCSCGETLAYKPRDYATGQTVRQIDGEHDVFGDGTVVCVPTHGHTPGHQSLRVRTEAGECFLCGDACYMRRTLEEMALPGLLDDADAMRESLTRIRAYQAAGSRIFFGHDPDFWATLPRAPAPVA